MVAVTYDLNIGAMHPLISPVQLSNDIPLTEETARNILKWRGEIASIVAGKSERLVVVVGPCSIHDTKAGLEYATRLKLLAEQHREDLLIVMRVYFEKPRTRLGWKGLVYDPDLDGSNKINKGLHIARQFLRDVSELGLPTATEFLDTTFAQYFADTVCVGAIGARTTESQIHRQMSSGLSMPVGFKNRTDGDIGVAIDSIISASGPHCFPGLTREGLPAIVETLGNPNCFLILRGGSGGPNYQSEHIRAASNKLAEAGLSRPMMIDCSHGNSQKQFDNQPRVVEDICQQISSGENKIGGVMIESHLKEGNQSLNDPSKLEYGQSITDACVSWETTLEMSEKLARAVKARVSL